MGGEMILAGRNIGIIRLILTAILTFLVTSGAWAATITGNIQNGSGKAGRVYVRTSSNNYGTSFTMTAGQTLPFTIRGITDNGPYSVEAFMDVTGDGVRQANEPAVVSDPEVQITNGTASVGTISLTNPSVPFSVGFSPLPKALQADNGVFLMLDGDFQYDNSANEEFAVAETFSVERGTAVSGSCASPTGVTTIATGIKNRDQGAWVDKNGLSTSCYRVTAQATGQTSVTSSWEPVTARLGTRTVSGTMTITGATPTGPLYLALVDESVEPPKIAAAGYASPSTTQSFTITGVADGNYNLFGFVDMNNNGYEDFGDIAIGEQNITPVVVSGANVTGVTATMPAGSSLNSVTTSHWTGESLGGYFDNYSLNFTVDGMLKRPVTVVVNSGPGLSSPVDVGCDDWGFSTWVHFGSTRPTVGGEYSVSITYSDTSIVTTTVTVDTVLDAFAGNLSPSGNVLLNQNQIFSWTAPSSPPGYYTYELDVMDTLNYSNVWDIELLPSTTTSVTYNQNEEAIDPLVSGTTYQWFVSVEDAKGNGAYRQVIFTPSSGPAINGFTPAGGFAGNTVYIDGINFSPTAGNNVVSFSDGFSGWIQATVTAATTERLTVAVPNGVGKGKIRVTTNGVGPAESASNFTVGTTGSFSGSVVNSAGTAQAGATVSLAYNPSVATTSAAVTGAFSLTGLPSADNYALLVQKTGYLPVVSPYIPGGVTIPADNTLPFRLFTQTEVRNLGVYDGKGVVVARVVDGSGNPVGGAVASITSYWGKTYTASYTSDGVTIGGTSTSANNGIIIVPNIEPGDTIMLDATKAGWSFSNNPVFYVRPFAVSEGSLSGTPAPPTISSISPIFGKPGSSVIITGTNLDSTQSVTLAAQSATFTINSSTQLTVTVPAGASTGVFAVTTSGGSATSAAFTVQQTLTVATAGAGTGTVTSSPVGISCQSGSSTGCSDDFDKSTSVTLVATPSSSTSVFSGWSGACTASSGDCVMTMDADKSVTATFSAASYLKLINGATETSYALLSDAYAAAATGNTIKAKAMDFTGPFNLNRAISVILNGGYDSDFNLVSGYTSLLNGLTISLGSVTVSGVTIE